MTKCGMGCGRNTWDGLQLLDTCQHQLCISVAYSALYSALFVSPFRSDSGVLVFATFTISRCVTVWAWL
jgi:hypothetical protein